MSVDVAVGNALKALNCYPYSPVPMMKLLKVVLKAEGSVDLNDPKVQGAVLNHVSLIPPLGDLTC